LAEEGKKPLTEEEFARIGVLRDCIDDTAKAVLKFAYLLKQEEVLIGKLSPDAEEYLPLRSGILHALLQLNYLASPEAQKEIQTFFLAGQDIPEGRV